MSVARRMTDAEIADRITDGLRHVQCFFPPNGMVVIYAEDQQNDVPGKKYLFHLEIPLATFRLLFEAAPPASMPSTPA